jgi:hypothetical protein
VGFVGYDRVAPLFEADAVFDGFEDEGKSLDGDDDDGLRFLERLGQLLGFRAIAFFTIDAADHAIYVLELVNCFL